LRLEIDVRRLGLEPVLEIGHPDRERALHLHLLEQVADLPGCERLLQVVPGTAPDRLHGRLERRVRGHHDDDDIGVLGEELRDEVEAAVHPQPEIEKCNVEHRPPHRFQGHGGRPRLRDLRIHRLQTDPQSLPDVLFIIDDHYGKPPHGGAVYPSRRGCPKRRGPGCRMQ